MHDYSIEFVNVFDIKPRMQSSEDEFVRVYSTATKGESDGRNARMFAIKLYQIRD